MTTEPIIMTTNEEILKTVKSITNNELETLLGSIADLMNCATSLSKKLNKIEKLTKGTTKCSETTKLTPTKS